MLIIVPPCLIEPAYPPLRALYPYGHALDGHNLYLLAGVDRLGVSDGTPDLAIHPYRPPWCEIGDRHAIASDQGLNSSEHRARAVAHCCHKAERRQSTQCERCSRHDPGVDHRSGRLNDVEQVECAN